VRKLRFVQADVFAETPFGGNPVVVVPNAIGLSPEEMQEVARGMGPVETAFVTASQSRDAHFRVGFFTPTTRIRFSGHPLLGTAYVLAREGRFDLEEPITRVVAETEIGQVHVDLYVDGNDISRVVLAEKPPVFGQRFEDLGEVAAGLNTTIDELLEVPLPIQPVSTELAALIVPLTSLEAVQDVIPHQAILDELCAKAQTACVLVYSLETIRKDATAHVRVFAPPVGVEEDPATGSANGALGAYLVRHRVITVEPITRMRCEQGYEIGRPSLVHVTIETTGDELRIRVGGRVMRSVDGHIFF
jgi:trans-2,3-dihydro-3-hydroxyanthranilate isomerase